MQIVFTDHDDLWNILSVKVKQEFIKQREIKQIKLQELQAMQLENINKEIVKEVYLQAPSCIQSVQAPLIRWNPEFLDGLSSAMKGGLIKEKEYGI